MSAPVQIDDAVISAAIDKALTRWLAMNNAFVAATIQSAVASSIEQWIEQRDVQNNDAMRRAIVSAVKQWMSTNKAAMLNTIRMEMQSGDDW